MKTQNLYVKNRQSNEYSCVRLNSNLLCNISDILEQVRWQPVYSDAYVLKNNKYYRYRLNIWQFLLLFFFSYKFKVKQSNNMVWYPFATKRGNLSFSYRSDNGFSKNDRYKQCLAAIFACILNVIKPFNRPQLIFEKLSERAQESGFAYFNYVQVNYPKEKIFFVIKHESSDYYRVKGLNNIVLHGSFRYFYLLYRSGLFVSSETPGHVYFWRENMGITANMIKTKPYVFLQHGVLGFKKLDNIFYNDRLTSPILLITSSKFEQNIVVEQLGFKKESAPITGLTRWDLVDLKEERNTTRDKILIFYTWRPWLDDVSDEVFKESDYLFHIKKTITTLRNEHINKKIVLMLHPKLHASLDSSFLSNIVIWSDKKGPLNELLSSVSVIITDYSSISWEAYYREIPVIFDMFDQDRYSKEVGSYINLNELPFGIKVTSNLDIGDSLKMIKNNNYQLSIKDKINKKIYFSYQDGKSSERIYKIINSLDMRAIRRKKNKAIIFAFLKILWK